jgi:hypothetical protein
MPAGLLPAGICFGTRHFTGAQVMQQSILDALWGTRNGSTLTQALENEDSSPALREGAAELLRIIQKRDEVRARYNIAPMDINGKSIAEIVRALFD